MCQILIKATDQRSSDPNKDVKLYKRGYPVAVKPDDHVWGRMETLPDFIVLKVPEMTVEEANKYAGARVELALKRSSSGKYRLRGNAIKVEVSGNMPVVTRSRNWKFDVDLLPSMAINQMKAKGFVEIKKDLAVKILTEA